MWLHVPTSAFAAGEADSTPDYDSLCLRLAASATWREKSLRPASWQRALKRAGWTTRLSGLTYSALTLDRGVAAWLASLEVSPVSPIASPASVLASSTLGTFGLSSLDWYWTLRLSGASSRTYQASLLTTGETYDPTYTPWATRLRRASSQRRRSARVTFANGSSSWPTAQVHDLHGPKTPEQIASMRQRTQAGVSNLNEAVQNWPTAGAGSPNSLRGEGQDPALRRAAGHQVNLQDAASAWPTPRSHETGDYQYDQGNHDAPRETLSGAIQNWPTPSTAPEAPNLNSNTVNGPTSLGEAVRAWATPMANDGVKPSAGNRTTADLSHQAQVMQTDGEPSSQSGRVLNPAFVEALMGWPGGATDYESSAMESSLWSRRMRSVLSLLGWEC